MLNNKLNIQLFDKTISFVHRKYFSIILALKYKTITLKSGYNIPVIFC